MQTSLKGLFIVLPTIMCHWLVLALIGQYCPDIGAVVRCFIKLLLVHIDH